MSAAPFSQGDFPLLTDLFDILDSGVVRDEILVAISLYETLDIAPHDLPCPERCLWAVKTDGALTPNFWDGLLCVFHSDTIDIGLKIGVDGRLCKARLMRRRD